ncbi:hypothetical protein HF086_015497 [Spodoptera exigua]|uniref:Uncharacterized protein n=1 Tax=Spodoptera exigua TaxID=7107 RepID=A0A922SNF2_SPOEX|nr:hypothetical protein HF086_015497 [Spodoptera exigua]
METYKCGACYETISEGVQSPKPESEPTILSEIRALSEKLAPLEGLKDEILAMKSEFADLKSSLSKEFNDAVKEFSVKIINMEQRIVLVENMQDQVNQLQSRLEKLEEESDKQDQWSRMSNVEIKGVPQGKNENLFDILSKIGAKIKYNVPKTQINFITRVPSPQKDRVKPIIVSFCNRYVKEDFVAVARLESKTTLY